MKSKIVYLVLIVSLVGFFVPKDTFAYDIYYKPFIDYRFYVEDKNKNEVEDLKFTIHDINNKISFESSYDSENKNYYFTENMEEFYGPIGDISKLPKLPKEILPENLATELENISFLDYYSWRNTMEYLVEKYPSVDYTDENRYSPVLQVTVPLVLEETSGNYESPIKKIIFAKIAFYPSAMDSYMSNFLIINNNCTILNQQAINNDEEKEYFKKQLEMLIIPIRNNAYDYSEEVLSKFSGGNFASNEINSNNYQNRCSNRIASAEIASEEINANLTKEGRKETRIADYCECLPLYIQERKEQITINPATWNTGFVVLFLSMIIVTGSCLVLIKKKS